ncbi:hypothetical protein D6779_05295 [Candidatus Parcubacteria bacterium]|nr:MAG: hypothetical protein D6779_05295 [Candidatus Parcubacteria bacterium]
MALLRLFDLMFVSHLLVVQTGLPDIKKILPTGAQRLLRQADLCEITGFAKTECRIMVTDRVPAKAMLGARVSSNRRAASPNPLSLTGDSSGCPCASFHLLQMFFLSLNPSGIAFGDF